MRGFALLLIGAGAWLLYAAVTNQAPIKTVTAILQHPDQAANIIAGKPYAIGHDPVGGSTGGGSSGGTNGAAIVAYARSQIGKPYVFGGHGPAGWDCSGLTMEALKAGIGISVPHSATAQLLDPRGKKVAKTDLQPGDLVFPNLPPLAGDHVQIYSGNGNIIEAAHPKTNVREVPMWGFYTARRYTAKTGSTFDNSGGGGGGSGV